MTQAKKKPAPVTRGGLQSGEVSFGYEHQEYTPPRSLAARVILRSIMNDDGHFCGLEVAHV